MAKVRMVEQAASFPERRCKTLGLFVLIFSTQYILCHTTIGPSAQKTCRLQKLNALPNETCNNVGDRDRSLIGVTFLGSVATTQKFLIKIVGWPNFDAQPLYIRTLYHWAPHPLITGFGILGPKCARHLSN